jgi:hypothetical protein
MPKKPAAKAVPNKSEFVRNQPEGLSAADIMAKAKAAGITLTPAHIYTIRAAAKRRNGAAAPRGRRPSGGASAGGGPERQFIALALDIGLGRAEALLAQLKSRVQQLT